MKNIKILIIGDCNSIHILNYIKVVLEDRKNTEITLFDMNSKGISNTEAYNYYKDKDINIVLNNGLFQLVKNKFIRRIPKIRVLFHKKILKNKLRNLGEFDYCIIHFVDKTKAEIIVRNNKKYNKIIPVFWGSDLLRNDQIKSIVYKYLFEISYKIILNTENMNKVFQNVFQNKYCDKTEVIKFPIMSFGKIDYIQQHVKLEEYKKSMKLPKDKYIIVCGHSGTKEEQYQEMIQSISKCDDLIKEQCFFVFLMTYGLEDLKEYQILIKSLIKKHKLQGIVLNEYKKHDELLKLFTCAHIHITTISTDAFSAVMQEHIYSGALLLHGEWLNYYELADSGIYTYVLPDIESLTAGLQNAVLNYDEIKPQLSMNSALILDISSPQKIKTVWNKKVFIS